MATARIPAGGFHRQVCFRVGPDDWPHLEALIASHGSLQAAMLAAIRTAARARLEHTLAPVAPPARSHMVAGAAPAADEKPKPQRRHATPTRQASATRPAQAGTANGLVELNVGEAAALLGLSTDTLRNAIKTNKRPGRTNDTGFYLAQLDREQVRRSGALVTLRGASELTGLRPSTLRKKCKQGLYSGAKNDATGWRIPTADLL